MAPLVWLITGSTSGFGAEFVKALLAKGDKVIATARDTSKIAHFSEAGAAVLKLDLFANQTEFNKLAQDSLSIYGRVDVLVNNAGYSHFGTIEDDRTLLVEPGFFRTELLNANNTVYVDTKIPDYRPVVEPLYAQFKGAHQQQPGDPAKGVSRIIDAIESRGSAQGRPLPISLALGPDAVSQLTKKCTDTIRLVNDWKEVSSDTLL
ncbi:retinol dehydrogenase [Colletotrichum salicis]|uniref:Retinol dehydrogenase n=1 Tax=Colletotrichum salicis TaxID=1209931 RepID=A0A135V218_9PEZI|nr:retinol dehydrogenase [Colletotrichum salicis]